MTAVVGHVEWVDFLIDERLPHAGEIRQLRGGHAGPGGGGAMGALAVHALAGTCDFYCAVGGDETGARTLAALRAQGLHVHAARRDAAQPRAFAFLEEDGGQRTIVVLGEELAPSADDPLPWEALAGAGGVFLTAAGPGAARAARAAGHLVVAAPAGRSLIEAGVEADVLIASAQDAREQLDDELTRAAHCVVVTEGSRGGSWRTREGRAGRWEPAPLPGTPVDAYGCGDAFGAALAHALGAGATLEQACTLAARVGAAVRCCRAPGVSAIAAR